MMRMVLGVFALGMLLLTGPARAEPLVLDVMRVEVSDLYDSPRQAPHIEHMLKRSIESRLQEWATSQLLAKGSENIFKVEITEASVTEAFHQQEGKRMLFFSYPKMTEYHAKLVVQFKLYEGASLMSKAQAEVKVERQGEMETEDSIASHEAFVEQLLDQLVAELDVAAREQITQYFAGYIR